jgi:hypothetical protein
MKDGFELKSRLWRDFYFKNVFVIRWLKLIFAALKLKGF